MPKSGNPASTKLDCTVGGNPKGPCAHIIYTFGLKVYCYIGAKVYTIWVHGPLGEP